MTSTYALTYTRTHTATFVSDNMRNVLRDIILYTGLNPEGLLNDWLTTGNAIKTWLETGDLTTIIIEFFRPGSHSVEARWDFPIHYDGGGFNDEMWVDKDHLKRTFEKSAKPSRDCKYEIILCAKQGRPGMPGFSPCQLRSTEKLYCRNSGSVIATGDIMASGSYWR